MWIPVTEEVANPLQMQGYAGPHTCCDREQALSFLA